MTTLLVDADIFAFKASAVSQGTFRFDAESPPCVATDIEAALRKAQRDIDRTADLLKATRVVVCLTDESNFRKDVYPAYKSNRKGVVKPVALGDVKRFYAENFETYQRPGLEADDCMGILSTHPTLIKGPRIIVSDDKDMRSIPGLLYRPADKGRKPIEVSELEANRYFMRQTLTGDAVDGYPGCPRVGPKSPHVAALDGAHTISQMWRIVVDTFESRGLTEADAVTQARCARILRASDWDFQQKRVRLWSPPVLPSTFKFGAS